MNSLIKLIDEKIKRREKKIIGTAVSFPYLLTLGTRLVWVVDILIGHDKELMKKVPISENNRQIFR